MQSEAAENTAEPPGKEKQRILWLLGVDFEKSTLWLLVSSLEMPLSRLEMPISPLEMAIFFSCEPQNGAFLKKLGVSLQR